MLSGNTSSPRAAQHENASCARTYGPTDDIEGAVEGHKKEVLSALGISQGEPAEAPGAAVAEDGAPVLTQDGIADLFAELHYGRLRYCHSRGSWYTWEGTYWKRDDVHAAFQFARLLG